MNLRPNLQEVGRRLKVTNGEKKKKNGSEKRIAPTFIDKQIWQQNISPLLVQLTGFGGPDNSLPACRVLIKLSLNILKT